MDVSVAGEKKQKQKTLRGSEAGGMGEGEKNLIGRRTVAKFLRTGTKINLKVK